MEKELWVIEPREHYLEMIRVSRDTPFIKVITGLRRSGKSTLMRSFRDELISAGVPSEDIFSIDFDIDEADRPSDHRELTDYVNSKLTPGPGKYLFFDEIQNVEEWEVSIASFYTSGADVYITGSNSQMLSSELATKLSGRDIEIHMMPLTFGEYVSFRKGSGLSNDRLFQDFLKQGSLPAVAKLQDTSARVLIPQILTDVYNTVYAKDIERRHNITDSARMVNLVRYAMRNIGDRTSARKASDFLQSKGVKVSHVTVENYLDYLSEAFLMYRAKRMSSKTKEYLSTSDKFFASDLGIRNMIVPFRPEDLDGLLENMVFNELRFRFREVAVYDVDGSEIDFVADPLGRPSYYQVCISLADPKTLERELRPLKAVDDNNPKFIITYDRYLTDDIDGIKIVQIVDWLLGE